MNSEADTLTAWMSAPRVDRALSIVRSDGYQRIPYPRLAELIDKKARDLQSGSDPGEVVGILESDRLRFVVGFFAAVRAGLTPLALPPRGRFVAPVDYAAHVLTLCRSASVGRLITEDALITGDPRFEAACLRALDSASGRCRDSIVQFTSGSTGDARALILDASSVVSHVRRFADRLNISDDEQLVTWLPFHHDLGLIGTLVLPVLMQLDLVVMTPEQFVAAPDRWLLPISECSRESITMAPPFGVESILRRSDRTLDLSRWRLALTGAEPVDPHLMRRFSSAFAPAGLRYEAPTIAYGMAEAILCVTAADPTDGIRVLDVAPSASVGWLAPEVRQVARLCDMPVAEDGAWLVSCGAPLDGVAIEVRGEQGDRVPEGAAGEVWMQAAGVPGATDAAGRPGGWFPSGDSGLIVDGELYVLGRMGDRVKVRGEAVHAEQIELRVARRLGLPAHRLAIVPGGQPRQQGISVLWDATGSLSQRDARLRALRAEVEAACGGAVSVAIYAVRHGTIPRTTSGKTRRREAWKLAVSGALGVPTLQSLPKR